MIRYGWHVELPTLHGTEPTVRRLRIVGSGTRDGAAVVFGRWWDHMPAEAYAADEVVETWDEVDRRVRAWLAGRGDAG